MRAPFALSVLSALLVSNAGAQDEERTDLYFGEAMFYAQQGRYFDALERLDTELAQYYGLDEPELDTFYRHVDEAEFSVGDFELNYRMHHRAGRAIAAVLEGDVPDTVRNEAAFRLARIHFQKGQLSEALAAIARIEGRLPDGLAAEIGFLEANVLIADGRPAEAAQRLRRLQGVDGQQGYAEYNLGIALLEDDRRPEALTQLDRAGRVDAASEDVRAIRDKANLVLGSLLMEDGAYAEARASLDRVSLEGPLSNQALLNAGWAAMSGASFDRAIVPWTLLAERNTTDAAVQEARLALPYAYSQLEIHGRAAILYGEALASFDSEARKLDASIDSIRKGDFLDALIREEVRQDKDWVIRLRELPESPETFYLMELMASHDFQTALQNLLDLEDLRSRLAGWERGFDAYAEMVELRRAFYEPLLPEIDQRFRELDSRIRLRQEQYRLLKRRRDDLLIAPRADFLATTEERQMNAQIAAIEQALAGAGGAEAAGLRERLRRVRGALHFRLETEYHDRLTVFDRNLRDLQAEIDAMTLQYESFVRMRQAAVHSFEGYDIPLGRLRTRVGTALASVELLMARQGHILELVAVDELLARRDRLNHYRDQARFALADSYDRATKARELEFAGAGAGGQRDGDGNRDGGGDERSGPTESDAALPAEGEEQASLTQGIR